MSRNRLVLLIVGGAVIALFFTLDLGRFLTLDALKANRQALVAWQQAHPIPAVLGFMAVYIVQTALSLPGAAILSLAAGALFGPLLGTVYANVAATIGATLAFLVCRYLLFLRLVPLFPFFLVNLAAGLTRLPLRTFFLATMLGIVPGGFVYVNAGASLATIDSLAGIVSPRVLGSFALLGLFALAPALYQRWQAGRRGTSTPE